MRTAFAAMLACGCGSATPSHPVDKQALLGDWELWCVTESERSATCLGKDPDGVHEVFDANGTVRWWDRDHEAATSDWKLEAGVLELGYRTWGNHERSRAWMIGRALVIWDEPQHFGRVYGRHGERLELAPSEQSSGAPVERVLGGVRYRLTVPAGYRLGLDDQDRQRWEPGGDGFVYTVLVGKWPGTSGCPAELATLHVGGSSAGSHTYNVDADLCLAGTNLDLTCMAGHTRGYLEDGELAAAIEVCKTLAVVP